MQPTTLTMKLLRTLLIACLIVSVPAVADSPGEVLDEFHAAAARADLDAYFDLMTENVVFLGTDGGERWEGEAFRAFVSPHFEAGRGWEYVAGERYINYSDDGSIAWFDEALEHAALGHCRGSGVLVRRDGTWKVAQYNLSVPIPNDLVMSVVEQIRLQGAPAKNTPAQAAPSGDSDTGESSASCRKRRHKTNRPADC